VKTGTDITDLNLRRLLDHCAAGFVPVVTLIGAVPRGRLYRRLDAALKAGLLMRGTTAGEYRTTERGLALLAAPAGAAAANTDDPLMRQIPHLRLVAKFSPVHEAVAELTLAAIIARTHALQPTHHMNFILFGPKLTLKTTLGCAICHIVGADDRRAIWHAAAETAGSVWKRRNSKGDLGSERKVLETSPVVVIDELQRATKDMLRVLTVILHGSVEMCFENEVAPQTAAIMLIANPKQEDGDLCDKLGLDSAIGRRSITCDFARVTLSAEAVSNADGILDEIKRLGPIALPKPQDAAMVPVTTVRDILLACLASPDIAGEIDFAAVSLLAQGMSVWLPPEAALARVLHDYCLVASTLGRMRSDWQNILDVKLTALTGHAPGFVAAPEPVREPNPFSWNDHLLELGELLHQRGIGVLEAKEALANIRSLPELRKKIARLQEVLTERRYDLATAATAVAELTARKTAIEGEITEHERYLPALESVMGIIAKQEQLTKWGFTDKILADLRQCGLRLCAAGRQPKGKAAGLLLQAIAKVMPVEIRRCATKVGLQYAHRGQHGAGIRQPSPVLGPVARSCALRRVPIRTR